MGSSADAALSPFWIAGKGAPDLMKTFVLVVVRRNGCVLLVTPSLSSSTAGVNEFARLNADMTLFPGPTSGDFALVWKTAGAEVVRINSVPEI
jgi:hypothetical protein